MPLQESGEMYLETILILSKKSNSVRSIDICDYMNFSKPSISRAIRLLKDGGYVDMDGRGYLSLTPEGKDIAEKIYERHTLLTKMLVKLGVPEDVASEDACKIEHDISEETFNAVKNHIFENTKDDTDAIFKL